MGEGHLSSVLEVSKTNHSCEAEVVSPHRKFSCIGEDGGACPPWSDPRMLSVADMRLSHGGALVPGTSQLISLLHEQRMHPPFCQSVMEGSDLSVHLCCLFLGHDSTGHTGAHRWRGQSPGGTGNNEDNSASWRSQPTKHPFDDNQQQEFNKKTSETCHGRHTNKRVPLARS